MKIGLDLTTVQPQPAGMGHYLLGIAGGLAAAEHGHELHLFWCADSPFLPGGPMAPGWAAGARLVHHPLPLQSTGGGLGRLARRFWFEHRRMAGLVNGLALDVYHAPHYSSPPGLGAKLLLGVPDLSFFLRPKDHQWHRAAFFRAMCRQSLNRCHGVVVLSEAVKKDFSAVFPGFKKPVWVHPCAMPPPPPPQAKDGALLGDLDLAPGGYFLCPGTLEPRKNLVRLVAAHTRLRQEQSNTPVLVLMGKWGWNTQPLRRALEEPVAAGRVRVTGYVDDQTKWALLRGALAVVYPSLYEGFGIPVVEALAAGAPVITSAVGSTAEVAGDAALLVDPLDTQAITQAMHRLMADAPLRQSLAKGGPVRAAVYSPPCATQTLLRIYDRLAKG